MKQISNMVMMNDEPMIPLPSQDGEPGSDYCQLCGGKTRFIGGSSYDLENYECTSCKAVHDVFVEYHKGKVRKRILVSVY